MDSIPAFMLAEAAAFVLATARVAGFVVSSPFPGKNVPNKARIGLVLLLAWVAHAAMPARSAGLGFDLALLGGVPVELGVGLVIGFTVRVTYSAAEILGGSFAQATGLTMGAVYDPSLGTEDPVPARIVTLIAMLLLLALGAHRTAIAYTLESFRALPIGAAPDLGATALPIVGFVGAAMEAGVRLALPVMAIAIAVQLTLALVSRASPQLQVFSVGMGITVAAGLLAILGSIDDSAAGLGSELGRAGPHVEQVLEVTSSPRGASAP